MAVRRCWQRCALALTSKTRAAASVAATDGAVRSWNSLRGSNRSLSSGRPVVLFGGEWKTAFHEASGQLQPSVWQFDPVQLRSFTLADKCRSRPFRPSFASPLSTVSVEEQNVAANASTEPVTTSVEADAGVAEQPVQEFIPEPESTPQTPLVEAIRSQGLESAEDSSEEAANIPGTGAAVRSPDDGSSSASALLRTDSGREIQPGRVYIGGLPFALKGDELKNELRELCKDCGVVLDVELAQHRNQSLQSIDLGKHRGFAFLTMENQEQADAVIKTLNGTTAFGRPATLQVSYALKKIEKASPDRVKSKQAVPRRKMFVGNLHEGTTRLDLLNRFQQYGEILELKLITELHSQRSRGFAFVTFAEEEQAIKAVLDADESILHGSVLRVNIAKYPQGY